MLSNKHLFVLGFVFFFFNSGNRPNYVSVSQRIINIELFWILLCSNPFMNMHIPPKPLREYACTLSLKLPQFCSLGRQCFGENPWCSPYLLQVINPSFSPTPPKKKYCGRSWSHCVMRCREVPCKHLQNCLSARDTPSSRVLILPVLCITVVLSRK